MRNGAATPHHLPRAMVRGASKLGSGYQFTSRVAYFGPVRDHVALHSDWWMLPALIGPFQKRCTRAAKSRSTQGTDTVIDNHAGANTFQARLNELFAASQTRLTNLRVVKDLLTQDFRISAPYLSQLRTGVRDNPSGEVIAALAEYFSVSPDYFFDIPRRGECEGLHNADAEIVDQLTDLDTRKLLTSANGLSVESIELLVEMAIKMSAADHRIRRRFRVPGHRVTTETASP